jgi:phage terminase large subunit-like protein
MEEKFNELYNRKAAGGGKSYSILMDVLKYVDDPYYYAVFFRKTVKQIERTLWPEAKDMYDPFLKEQSGPRKGKFKGKAQIREKDKVIIFPSGAKVEFAYLDTDRDAKENFQGAQINAAYFDEFGHFSEFVFNYIRTRMRSKPTAKYLPYIRCTLNPEPNHFVLKYLSRYIGEDGLPIKEYSGRPAYFLNVKGEIITAWSEEELLKLHPDKKPRMYTFIPSSLSDNKKLLEVNPEYADDLLANDPANAELLLRGNWLYKPAANGVFEKSTIKVVDKVPLGSKYIRAWDKASSKPVSEGGDSKQKDPDYTASILFAKDKEGFIYVMGNYYREQDNSQRSRFRERPGTRDTYIEQQAYHDGDDVTIILPCDPGQAGIVELQESSKKLQSLGFTVKPDPLPGNKSKRIRFEPFCTACHIGNVFWVKSSFDPKVWDYLIMELENFDGDKNNGYHDDFVDCFSTAYASCLKEKVQEPVAFHAISAPTLKYKARI